MYPMISAVQRNNRRGLVYDHKGDFTAKTYRKGRDLIWNPLDNRSVKWTLFNDLRTMQDIQKMAHSMLPDTGEKGATGHFRHAARDLFYSCLLHCWQNGKRTNRELWKVLSAPIEELLRLFGESVLTERGAVHIQDAKQYAQSVIGSMMPSVNIIEYMPDGDFSVNGWLKDKGNPCLIYIVSRPDFEDFVRPALSLFIDFLGTNLLSQEDDHNRRMYFFMDEFPSLGYLPSIPKLLSTGRSKGFCGILAAQTNAQIVRHYGENVTAEIVNGCATHAVYNLRDPKSAEYFADAIGKHEVEYKTESITYGVQANGAKNGGVFATHRRIEHVVMPEELRMLPRLTTILKLADYPYPTKVKIPLCLLPTVNPSFVERPDMDLHSLIEAAKRAKELGKPLGGNDDKEPLKESGLDTWLTA
jgi:type IV secretory pathway TraG/TraD family ATPase VirD4